MRKLLMTLLLCVVFYFPSQGQTYDHYRYNQAGVPERTGYTTVRQPQQFTPARDPFDLNLYREVLQNKQAQYNKNTESLKNIVTSDWKLISNLTKPEHAELKTAYTDLLSTYTKEMSSGKYDYANSQVYTYWYNLLVKIYNDLIPFQQ